MVATNKRFDVEYRPRKVGRFMFKRQKLGQKHSHQGEQGTMQIDFKHVVKQKTPSTWNPCDE